MLNTQDWNDTQAAVAKAEAEFESAQRLARSEYYAAAELVVKAMLSEVQEKCSPLKAVMEAEIARADAVRIAAINKAFKK